MPVGVPSKPQAKQATGGKADEIIKRIRENKPLETSGAKRIKASEGRILRPGFSIKEQTTPKISQEEENLRKGDLPANPFTHEELMKVWLTYANILEKEGKMLMSNILKMREPELKGETIYLILDHSSGEMEYQNEKAGLLIYLKHELKNYGIELHHRIAETTKKTKKAYTLKDKLKIIQEENPAVLELVKRLNLDADA